MSNFCILHLSDAHIGKTETDQLAVLVPLLESIEKEVKTRTPNLLVFSGDLVQGCPSECSGEGCHNDTAPPENCVLEKQYEKATEFLNKVFDALSKKPGEIPLLIVPGNHDVNRHSIDEDFFTARSSYTEDIVYKKQTSRKKRKWKDRIQPQKRWIKFASNYPNHDSIDWDLDFNVPYGILEHDGVKIGFIGLNSSWAAGNDQDRQKLWIGREQHQSLYQRIQGTSFKIASAHHPITWLNEGEEINQSQKFETEFDVFFHGHEHSNWFTSSNNHLKVGGGAIYQGSKKSNGYSWLDIDFKNKSASIQLFQLSDAGALEWIPLNLPQKTDISGVSKINNLFEQDITTTKKDAAISMSNDNPDQRYKLDESLDAVIRQLESKFNVTWERHRFNDSSKEKHVFWPMKLREPTAIHASQCFIAAALQKRGCKINLYIDDFGPEYNESGFQSQIEVWFQRVGADFNDIAIEKYTDIVNRDIEKKREILETLLAKALSTIQILKISKIYNSNTKTEDLLSLLEKKKPRRLLTPAMTWTCLESLSKQNKKSSFITLGGYDEKILWDTWKICLPDTGIPVGHLFLSELDGLHMGKTKFSWKSRNDIEKEFTKARGCGTETSNNSMIPWCVNNCALVPLFVAEEKCLQIKGKYFETIGELIKLDDKLDNSVLIEAIHQWIV